jgi:hypothetical protein
MRTRLTCIRHEVGVRLKLDPETVDALRRYRGDRQQSDIVPHEDAVTVYGGLGVGILITLDGRVIEEDWFESRATELTDPLRIRTALVLGKRVVPELERLIPERPRGATDCVACESTGWRDLGEHRKVYVCPDCGGVGWREGA